MKLTSRILPVVLALAAPAFAQEDAKKKHQLRFNFKEGAVAKQVLSQDMTMTMSMGAEDMVTKMNMSMFQTFTVKSVKDGKAELEQKVTRVKAVMDNPMQQIDYDSAKEGSDPDMLEGLADMVGQTFGLKLTDRGEISDIKVPEDAGGEGGVDVEQMTTQIFNQLPAEPVAIGDTWTVDQKMPLGQMGESDTKVTYKLVSVSDSEIVLEQTFAMDLDAMEMPGGMTVESAKATGKVTLDRRSGLPKSKTMDMMMVMDGPMAMEMELKLTMKPAPADKKAPITGPKKGGEKKDAGK
jgi:hypothetical protein